jgi:hypothetical protein
MSRIKFLILLLPVLTLAQIKVDATTDRAQVAPGQTITFTVTVSGEGVGSPSAPEFPSNADWSLRGTSQSQSTSMQIVNGKVSSSKAIMFIYYLTPNDTGDLEIPSVKVIAASKQFNTKPVSVRVSGKSSQPSGAAVPSPSTPTKADGKELFLSSEWKPETLYVGQQLTVDYSLFTRVDLANVQFEKSAEFKNFWVEKLFDANRLALEPKNIKGVRYYGMLIKRVAAFPLSAGKQTVEPLELTCTIRYPPRSFFDFGKTQDVDVASPKFSIVVLSLPESGKPDNFTGAVGQYTIAATADKCTLCTGDAITYTVTVSGNGNIEALEIPEPKFPSDFEVFDRKQNVSKKPSNNVFGGKKSFDYIIVPHSEGKFVIPELTFSFFDPSKRKYQTQTTDEITIDVKPGKGGASVAYSGKSAVVSVSGDIEYIDGDVVELNRRKIAPVTGLNALWFFAIELLLIVGAVIYRKKQEKNIENWRLVKSSKALKGACKKIDFAKSRKDHHQALSALTDAIFGYIGDKLQIDSGAVMFDESGKILVEKGVGIEQIESLKKILDEIDLARFSPEGTIIDIPKMTLETEQILRQIDIILRKKGM